jgi:hypothetical protein
MHRDSGLTRVPSRNGTLKHSNSNTKQSEPIKSSLCFNSKLNEFDDKKHKDSHQYYAWGIKRDRRSRFTHRELFGKPINKY